MNVWILTYARSGSTYLREILDRTHLFSNPFKEYLHHSNHATKFRSEFDKNPYKFSCSKVLRSHFDHKFTDNEKPYIETKLPNLKYILLRRKDIYAVTASLFFAEKTNFWNTTNIKTAEANINRVVPYDEQFMLECYRKCKNYYNSWDNYLKNSNFVDIEYEDLCQNPKEILTKILNHCNMSYDQTTLQQAISCCKTQKITKKETTEYIEKLKTII